MTQCEWVQGCINILYTIYHGWHRHEPWVMDHFGESVNPQLTWNLGRLFGGSDT